jgi:uncharacterized protein YoxC
MNTTALWVLDAIVALGMIGAAIAIVSIWRALQQLAQTVSATMTDLQNQVGDVKEEAVNLMRSTEVTEHHFDQLAERLSRLTSSTDAVVRVLPAMAVRRDHSVLPRMLGDVARAMSAVRFVKSIFLRRKR